MGRNGRVGEGGGIIGFTTRTGSGLMVERGQWLTRFDLEGEEFFYRVGTG